MAASNHFGYYIEISSNNCAFQILINDFEALVINESGPLSTTLNIGQFLKSGKNKIVIGIWDSTADDSPFDRLKKDAFATFRPFTFNRRDSSTQAIREIKLIANPDSDSPQFFILRNQNNQTIHSTTSDLKHIPEEWYMAESFFTIGASVPRWKWVESMPFAKASFAVLNLSRRFSGKTQTRTHKFFGKKFEHAKHGLKGEIADGLIAGQPEHIPGIKQQGAVQILAVQVLLNPRQPGGKILFGKA